MDPGAAQQPLQYDSTTRGGRSHGGPLAGWGPCSSSQMGSRGQTGRVVVGTSEGNSLREQVKGGSLRMERLMKKAIMVHPRLLLLLPTRPSFLAPRTPPLHIPKESPARESRTEHNVPLQTHLSTPMLCLHDWPPTSVIIDLTSSATCLPAYLPTYLPTCLPTSATTATSLTRARPMGGAQ